MGVCLLFAAAAGLLCEYSDHIECVIQVWVQRHLMCTPLGMMGFMIWDANSTDIGMPARSRY